MKLKLKLNCCLQCLWKQQIFLSVLFVVSLLSHFTAPLTAQETPIKTPSGASNAAYRLGAGDVLTVSVLGELDLSADNVSVSTDGKIYLPLIGALAVKDKTVDQVAVEVTKKLRGELQEPHVTVTLKTPRAREIFVLGAVARPGVLTFKEGWRVSEALASAGGTTDRPELLDATLVRADAKPVILDLPALMRDSNSVANLLLQSGDTLRFSTRTMRVSVVGEVTNSGIVDLANNSNIAEAVNLAGGLKPNAALSKTTVKRINGAVVSVDLRKALQGDAESNIRLQPGDVVTIPEFNGSVTVLGAVVKPGFYPMEDGKPLKIAEAVVLAGGPSDKAALTRATIQHKDNTAVSVDLYKVLRQVDQTANVELQPGDVVTIPEFNGSVTVLGAVVKPGFYPMEDGKPLKIAEAVVLAGGPSDKAALSEATVRHTDGTLIPVNLYKVLTLGDQAANIEAQSGDVLVIPEMRGITVLGSVLKPGTYYIEAGKQPNVRSLLALAGGLTISNETARITLSRPVAGAENIVRTANASASTAGSTSVTTPIASQMRETESPDNEMALRDGDLLTVSPKKTPLIYVNGEVEKPGPYEIKETDGLAELLMHAGGPTAMAALTKIQIISTDGKTNTVDMEGLRNGTAKPKIALQEGDWVMVPQNKRRVKVMAAVSKPGDYPIPENGSLTVGEALNLAGGPIANAKISEIGLLRETPAGVEVRTISLSKVREGDLTGLNQKIEDGDVIYVPPGKVSRPFWQQLTGILAPLRLFGAF